MDEDEDTLYPDSTILETDETDGRFPYEDMNESPPEEEEVDPEEVKRKRNESYEQLKKLLKLISIVPKQSMHQRVRYKYTSRLSKIVQHWMKEHNLRGLDYFKYLMLMLTFALTSGPKVMRKKKKRKRRPTPFVSVFKEQGDSSSETSASEPIEMETGDPFLKHLEEMKKTHPELIENLKRKQGLRKERNMLNVQKINRAVKAFLEAKEKSEEIKESERMCYMEKKDPPPKKCELSLDDFLKKEGFPAPPMKSVPPQIFTDLGIDKETFEKDYPLMDEEDLIKFHEIISQPKDLPEEEEDEDELLRRRGRFRFKNPLGRDRGEEEGADINLAKWEQEYWRLREEKDRKKAEKKEEPPKEPEMELCQLMLVRCGTSWKQELGYTEGWTDTTRLGKKGRKDMEQVAAKILKRGYKFDHVLTSSLGRSWRTADLMLSGSGQEKMTRYSCWELNPRHQGKLEGQTDLGSASQWGWLPQEWFAFTTPPPIRARDPMPDDMAYADPTIPETLPRAENIYHVQERVLSVWDHIQRLFKEQGKRTILVCAHKDSIEAILFHAHGFIPTDFTVWHPSYRTPVILMWYMLGDELIPAFVDFLCDIDEADKQTEDLTICWLERFIDQGILDCKTLADIKSKMDNKEEVPDLQDLWEDKFNESLRNFESNAEKIGQMVRQMNYWLERGYVITPDEKLRITEDTTVFKEFTDHLQTIADAGDPLSDVLTLDEQMDWIVDRDIMPLELKIFNLRQIAQHLHEESDPVAKERLFDLLNEYETMLSERLKQKQAAIDADRPPEEKFADGPPETFGDLETLDDWDWAARNKQLPGHFKIPRKDLIDDWNEDSAPTEEMAPEEFTEEYGQEEEEEERVSQD